MTDENFNEYEVMDNLSAEQGEHDEVDNQEPEITDDSLESEETIDEVEQPQYYSLEEIESLSEDDVIDESRLSPAMLNLISKMNGNKEKTIDDLLEDNKGFAAIS